MNNLNLREKIKTIPPLSSVVIEVLDLINTTEEVEFDILEKKIIQDARLTAKVLALANSSFFGMSNEIRNIKEACVILGINIIRNLVVSSAVMERFGENYGNNLDFRKLWEHSIATASAAKVYSREFDLNENTAFISGLLHDIGKMAIDYYIPELYEKVMEYKSVEDCLSYEAELQILGYDHGQIGAWVCEYWNLPNDICSIIKNHHGDIDLESGISLDDILVISDVTSHGLGHGSLDNSYIPLKDDSIFRKTGISISMVQENLSKIEAITDSYRSSM